MTAKSAIAAVLCLAALVASTAFGGFVDAKRWADRRWTPTVCALVDGKPEFRVNAWGVVIGKCFRGTTTGNRAIARGRQFDLAATTQLEWIEADNLAPFEEAPGELQHLAEFGAHISLLRANPPPGLWKWEHDLILPVGVMLHYQPELTAEQKARGDIRPSAVVGSYAVFDGDGCKIAHIMRPCAIDATSKRVWGTISIADGVSTVTFKAADVAGLVAPITIYGLDTLGYTTVGTTDTSSIAADYARYFTPFTAPGSGNVTAIALYLSDLRAGNKLTLGLYATSGGSPNGQAKLFETTEITTATYAWNSAAPSSSPATVTGGTAYALAANHDGAGGTLRIVYDTVAGINYGYGAQTYATLPLPASATYAVGASDRAYSIYCTYTPAVSFVPYPRPIHPDMTGGINE